MRKAFLRGLTAAGALCLVAGMSHAQLNKAITVDGNMELGTEWVAASDKTDTKNVGLPWGDAQDVEGLYVTWDLEYLYIGVSGNQTDGRLFVFVDGNANGANNEGWINTTGAMQDFSGPFDTRMSNLDIEFPEGFKPEICASAPANFSAGAESGGYPNNGGVRTFNGGAVDDFGWDQSGTDLLLDPANMVEHLAQTAPTSSTLEVAIRWNRVFNGQADNGDYDFGTGELPASVDGEIGILVVHTSDGDNPWVSPMWLPVLLETGDIPPTDAPGDTAVISTVSSPRYMSGVRVLKLDTTTPGFLDLAGNVNDGRASLNNNDPLVITVSGAEVFYSNDMVQVVYSADPLVGTGAEAGSALNLTNYTLSAGSVLSAAMGVGDRANEVFLTLDAEIAADVTLDIANIEDAGQTGSIPAASLTVSPKNIIDVTVDATGDAQGYLPDPYIRGSWNGWSEPGWPLTDGTDAYPDVPGNQIEAGDVAGDKIYRGRVFTSGGLMDGGNPQKFAVRSMYDFGGGLVRGLGAGYWMPSNFDILSQTATISFTDETDNRLTENAITVNLRALVPTNFFADQNQAENDATVWIQSGPTFGGEGAIPTVGGVLPGEQDVTGGLALTYAGIDGTDYVYTGSVDYEAGLPDVGEYRLGVQLPPIGPGDDGLYREEYSDFSPADISHPAPVTVDAGTVHGHVHRLQSVDGNKSLGRTLDITFRTATWDVPAPGSTFPTNVNNWELYN